MRHAGLNFRTLLITSALAAGALSLTILPGCLVSGASNENVSGRYISPTTIGQIEPGVTTADSILGLLGEPHGKSASKDGGEIWRWDYTKHTKSAGAVLLVFAGSDSKIDQVTTYAHIRDGVVVRTWQDKSN